MRKILFIVVVMCLANSGWAQYVGYTQLTDISQFTAAFTAASKKTNSIKSDFVQEKELSMLSEKIISKGKCWFKKNNLVRMEYTQPFQYLMIINNDKIYIKDGQKETRVSSRSNKLFQQVNKIMIDCMQGTALTNRDFKTRVFENKGTYLVELVPVASGIKAMFKNINVVVDKRDYAANSIEMQEVSGDHTLIRFVNRELNSNLQDALFTIR